MRNVNAHGVWASCVVDKSDHFPYFLYFGSKKIKVWLLKMDYRAICIMQSAVLFQKLDFHVAFWNFNNWTAKSLGRDYYREDEVL